MSVATVKAHVSRLLVKLEVENRVQVALLVQDARESCALYMPERPGRSAGNARRHAGSPCGSRARVRPRAFRPATAVGGRRSRTGRSGGGFRARGPRRGARRERWRRRGRRPAGAPPDWDHDGAVATAPGRSTPAVHAEHALDKPETGVRGPPSATASTATTTSALFVASTGNDVNAGTRTSRWRRSRPRSAARGRRAKEISWPRARTPGPRSPTQTTASKIYGGVRGRRPGRADARGERRRSAAARMALSLTTRSTAWSHPPRPPRRTGAPACAACSRRRRDRASRRA